MNQIENITIYKSTNCKIYLNDNFMHNIKKIISITIIESSEISFYIDKKYFIKSLCLSDINNILDFKMDNIQTLCINTYTLIIFYIYLLNINFLYKS